MLKKNARLERMYQRGFRQHHAMWVDTYNKQYGKDIIYTVLAGISSRNHYYVAVELWIVIALLSSALIVHPKMALSCIQKVLPYAFVGGAKGTMLINRKYY